MFKRTAHGRAHVLGLAFFAATAGTACDTVRSKVQQYVCEPGAAGAGAPSAAAAGGGSAEETSDAEESAGEAGAGAPPKQAKGSKKRKGAKSADAEADAANLTGNAKFALPFAWQKSPEDPLARARTFLRELADDNQEHMGKGAAFFHGISPADTPRATIVMCTDSRVQVSAFDATAENDDYTVRNLANQVEVGLGSVQFGVDHLKTPVLMILGHTGCEAVKTAITGTSHLEEPIRRELSGLHLAPPSKKKKRRKKSRTKLDDKHWAEAVQDNVHDQVKAALRRFGARVTAGELTIIGAVYDLRNDLGRGAGKLLVIDVNGNRDEARLKAFTDAIMAIPNPNKPAEQAPPPPENPLDRLARALAESADTSWDDEDGDEEDDFDEDEPTSAAPAALPAGRARK